MRLTCPTCGATYEIDGSVLPPGGRDVQCSNCGSTWFQEPPGNRDEASPETPAAAEAGLQAPKPATEPDLTPSDAAAAVPSSPRRRRPDEAVLDVLRQEREHEARARASEETASAPEPPAQPSTPEGDPPVAEAGAGTDRRERARVAAAAALGRARKRRNSTNPLTPKDVADQIEAQEEVDTSAAITQALEEAQDTKSNLRDHPRDDMGATRDVAPDPLEEEDLLETGSSASAPQAGGSSRRNLLPDIEEINSTLRPDERAAEQAAAAAALDPVAAAEKRSGFTMGFSVVLLIALALVLLYTYSAPIAEAVPALAGPMDTYREWGDGLRISLDSRASDLADWLSSSASAE